MKQHNAQSVERLGGNNARLDESSVFMTEGGIFEREDDSAFYSVSPVNASIQSTLREFPKPRNSKKRAVAEN